ncbi:MAG: glycyl-radical enzyme activating protein, partial [Bacteroidales bacterium]|nr:glycyl-radical enzyme activating protein [Bacteroidales bacterium]
YAPTIIRIPLIPGITDDQTNLEAIKSILKPLRCVKRIDLLPYHHMAKDKYRRMNLPYKLEDLNPYTANQLGEIKSLFNDIDIPVTIGG